MRTPVLNNHLKRQFILLGNNEDLQRVVSDLNTQGETVRYCCCIDQNNEKYLTIEQCLDICLLMSRTELAILKRCISIVMVNYTVAARRIWGILLAI